MDVVVFKIIVEGITAGAVTEAADAGQRRSHGDESDEWRALYEELQGNNTDAVTSARTFTTWSAVVHSASLLRTRAPTSQPVSYLTKDIQH